jgi:hypothetical protein
MSKKFNRIAFGLDCKVDSQKYDKKPDLSRDRQFSESGDSTIAPEYDLRNGCGRFLLAQE